jgi:hypothetical protein
MHFGNAGRRIFTDVATVARRWTGFFPRSGDRRYGRNTAVIFSAFLNSAIFSFGFLTLPGTAAAVDHLSLERDGQSIHITGQVLTEAVDGGLLVLDREGVVWMVQPDELKQRTRDDTPYEPMQAKELEARLLDRMPPGSRVHNTAHYLILYNTSPAYAQWCGALYERLYLAFCTYWEHRGLKLQDPKSPLVAMVFDGQASYEQYARAELGDSVQAIVAYYSLRTNRVTMHDLTGSGGLQGVRGGLTSTAQINALLMKPEAFRMVATIIHEATHQLAYNCGFHTRFADIPLWVSEGLAVYFETPDLRSSRGWRNIGGIHRHRLGQFRKYLAQRPPNSLSSLIADDSRFRNTSTGPDAYAEAWALNYYLIRNQREAYNQYMKYLAAKPPMVYDTPADRLAAFREAFGKDPDSLDQDFLRYMRTVR